LGFGGGGSGLSSPTFALGAEATLASFVGDTTDQAIGANGVRYYNIFTPGIVGDMFVITGLEWKNGAVIIGNVGCGIVRVDANPPTVNNAAMKCFASTVAQVGASAIQRNNILEQVIIEGGVPHAMYIQMDTGTATIRELPGAGAGRERTEAFSSDPPRTATAAWNASPNTYYFKVYGKKFV